MNYAVILSGGVGTRMGNPNLPKQYMLAQGKPVLVYTLERFQACPEVDSIVVVANRDWEQDIDTWVKEYGITKFAKRAEPGATRQESLLSGLLACESQSEGDIVLVHDAARPLLSVELITRTVEAMPGYDAVLPVLEIRDTVYQSTDGKNVTALADRSTLFCGQSPETFRLQKYLQLNLQASKEELEATRGGCEMAFRNGLKVGILMGEDWNFKLTTPADMDRLLSYLSRN